MAKSGKTAKAELRRDQLRTALVAAAERTIKAEGLRGLRARALADEVGCSVGAIYNAVDDLDELILLVNTRTLASAGTRSEGGRRGAATRRARARSRDFAPRAHGARLSRFRRSQTSRAGARCSITACRPASTSRSGTVRSSSGCSITWRSRCASYSRTLAETARDCSRARCSLRCMGWSRSGSRRSCRRSHCRHCTSRSRSSSPQSAAA